MGTRSTPAKLVTGSNERRSYDSQLRRAQSDETRARILAAGSALAHQASSWDWRDITIPAVARKAGVSERTVYRHFETEQQFREALLRRLEQEAGVSYDDVDLDDLTVLTSRLFESLPSFAATPGVMQDESFGARDQRRRNALLKAVSERTKSWSEDDRRTVAAILDVLWLPPSYERLVAGWGMDTACASAAVTWAIDVLVKAIRDGARPGSVTATTAGPRER
jgi:AcrR family transcriptional regulator